MILFNIRLVIFVIVLTAGFNASAQSTISASAHCAAVKASVRDAGFASSVEVFCDDERAYLNSNVYPSHNKMTGIVASNEQTAVPAEGYQAPIVLSPELTTTPKTRDSSLAIAVNGVPIFDYTSGGELSQNDLFVHQPHLDTIANQELDSCGGHAGRGDDYHYHERPSCMIDQMDNAGDDAIIGWAFDGFPLYGNNNPDGSTIGQGDLDVCNGQADSQFGYRYHTSDEPPYIIQCIMGSVIDFNALPRVGTTRPPGMPPNGGVDNFTFTELGNGLRTLTYNYNGQSYYINYTPSGEVNCYDYEYKTVSNGGVVQTGEFCSRVVPPGISRPPMSIPGLPGVLLLLQDDG